MTFTAVETVTAPQTAVFAALTDVATWEAGLARRGVLVRRADARVGPAPGMSWRVRFSAGGRSQDMQATLTRLAPPERVVLGARSRDLEVELTAAVAADGEIGSRLTAEATVAPRSLHGRFLVEGLRVGRTRIARRMQAKLGEIAVEIAAGRLAGV